MNADAVAAAFVWACTLDVEARKPGNVSRASPGYGMDADLFVASAEAAAAPLCAPGRPVGERIQAAVGATRAVAGCNTNLGIVLLCAPLAAAVERWSAADGAAGLRSALAEVLRGLDLEDARAAYRAIALARPGGLGALDVHDVARPASIALGAAMALAADRDRIAWQYGHAHADLFETGLPAFAAALGASAAASAEQAMQRVYLEFLAARPDSHIVRKHGASPAHSVMNEARVWLARARRGEALDADAGFAGWDASLKARGLNPGTCADLGVGTAFVAALGGSRPRLAGGAAAGV
jgi:triphosphoribosyl-dephospho-CoA synthase